MGYNKARDKDVHEIVCRQSYDHLYDKQVRNAIRAFADTVCANCPARVEECQDNACSKAWEGIGHLAFLLMCAQIKWN